MQERWLSPRVLHYGRDQLLWECRELDACETYPDGLPKPLRDFRSGFKIDPEVLKPLEYWRQDDNTESHPDSVHLGTWDSIVRKYSVTSLTKGEDKLVAISGIAKRMQGLLDDEYLAGLWRKDLPGQLLWWVDNGDLVPESPTELPPARPRPYRAPSWSWASIDHEISTGYRGHDGILIAILNAGVTPVGPDSTGQIKDGFIRLNGRIFLAELFRESIYPKLRMNSEILDGLCDFDPQVPTIGTISVYCMPILSYNYKEGEPWLEGLILQAAARGNGTYERIGRHICMGEKSCSALLHSQADKDKSLYEDANGETIVLI